MGLRHDRHRAQPRPVERHPPGTPRAVRSRRVRPQHHHAPGRPAGLGAGHGVRRHAQLAGGNHAAARSEALLSLRAQRTGGAIVIPLILLYLDTRLPHWATRPLMRAYARADDRKLRRQAARAPRFRLMTADSPDSQGIEWVRYIGQYKIPIITSEIGR